MYRLQKIEEELRHLLQPYVPNDCPKGMSFTLTGEKLIRIIDQLGAYRDGMTDAKDILYSVNKEKR